MPLDLLDRIEIEGTPLIDADSVTFVWRGAKAPRLVADFNKWEHEGGTALTEVEPGLWALTVELQQDAYVEYSFMDFSGGEGVQPKRIMDPLNPRKVTSGLGFYVNYFYMPGKHPTPYTLTGRDVPRGTVTEAMVEDCGLVVGGKRKVYFYQPPVSEPCPLLVVWDGQDYYRRAKITTIVDNLIHEGSIRPIALAMPEHGKQARLVEYGACDVTLGFIGGYVLPLAQKHLNLLDVNAHPGSYGILGASMGGLMALFAGLRLPHIFGKVFSQSGAFGWPEMDFVVWDLVKSADPSKLKIWMDVGHYEYLHETNCRMLNLLKERGFDAHLREYYGGHNYTSWRNDLPEGLMALFGENA